MDGSLGTRGFNVSMGHLAWWQKAELCTYSECRWIRYFPET